jgi:hypothetical protein
MKKYIFIVLIVLLSGTKAALAQEYRFSTNLNLHIQNASSGYSGTLPITANFTRCFGNVYMLINFNRSAFIPTHYTFNGVKYPIQEIKHLNPNPDVECVTFTADVVHKGTVCFHKKLSCVTEGTGCSDLGFIIVESMHADRYWKDFFFTVRIYEVEQITRNDYKLEGKIREMEEAKRREIEAKKKAEEEARKKEEEARKKQEEAKKQEEQSKKFE